MPTVPAEGRQWAPYLITEVPTGAPFEAPKPEDGGPRWRLEKLLVSICYEERYQFSGSRPDHSDFTPVLYALWVRNAEGPCPT